MSYIGLARKYRPKNFNEVVGQEEIAITLKNAIKSNKVHHAYIFYGSRGVGKTSMARIFAKALNCEKGPTVNPCNKCEACKRISQGEDVDVVEIDGASNRGIEEIRNIRENIKYLPTHSRFKIFIIDEIHMLTAAAFNALLKTLEEPPLHAKFIFATTQIHSIPDTILSRCQKFNFKKISIGDIVKRLSEICKKEKIKADKDVLEKIASITNGALRDSLVLLEQVASYTKGKVTEEALKEIIGTYGDESREIINAFKEKDIIKLLSIINDYCNKGGNINNLVNLLIQNFRDILIRKIIKDTTHINTFIEGTQEYYKWLESIVDTFSKEFLNSAIYHLLELNSLLYKNLLDRIVLETVLLKIFYMESLSSLKEIQENLLNLEKKISSNLNITQNFTNYPPPHYQYQSNYQQYQSNYRPNLQNNISYTSNITSQKSFTSKSSISNIEKNIVSQSSTYSTSSTNYNQVSLQNLNEWEKFIYFINKEFSSALLNKLFISKKISYRIEGDTLILEFPQGINQSLLDLLTTPSNLSKIEKITLKSFNRPLKIKIVSKNSQRESEKRAIINNIIDNPCNNVLKDEKVKKILELFGGKVVGLDTKEH